MKLNSAYTLLYVYYTVTSVLCTELNTVILFSIENDSVRLNHNCNTDFLPDEEQIMLSSISIIDIPIVHLILSINTIAFAICTERK